jgi:hypothetical protein
MFLKADIPRRRAPCQFWWNVMVCGLRLVQPAGAGRFRSAAGSREFVSMPSLIRLLMVVGLLGGVAYGAMFALANFVQPKQREMSITIPPQKLTKPN